MSHRFEDDEDLEREAEASGRGRRFSDFDCPDCNANNPRDERFGNGDEILCFYCGSAWRAKVDEEGRLRLVEA